MNILVNTIYITDCWGPATSKSRTKVLLYIMELVEELGALGQIARVSPNKVQRKKLSRGYVLRLRGLW